MRSITELFQEGSLVARMLYTRNQVIKNSTHPFSLNVDSVSEELSYLTQEKHGEGIHQNVERHGQRNRSATLLVPGVEMSLFSDVGLLYDADKSTIRAYMYKDSGTVSQLNHDKFYNNAIDRHKFEPFLSRGDFIKSYKKWVDNQKFDHGYNEVMGNFYKDGLVGIIANAPDIQSKMAILIIKEKMKREQGIDLPMVYLDNGAGIDSLIKEVL
jgi:hypothetical protein